MENKHKGLFELGIQISLNSLYLACLHSSIFYMLICGLEFTQQA